MNLLKNLIKNIILIHGKNNMNQLNKWLENYLLHLEHNNLIWLIKLKYLNKK